MTEPRGYKKIAKLLMALFPLLVCALLLLFILQQTQEFSYYYREQQQVFIYDADYVIDLLSAIGGLVTLMSQWLVQFFILPWMGAVISVLLCLIAACSLYAALYKYAKALWWIPFTLVPVALYNICLQDSYVHYEGLVALTLGCVFLWLYALVPHDKWVIRLCWGSTLMTVLFFLAGSIAVLISITLILFDLLRKALKAYSSFLILALVLLAGLVAVNRGWMVDFPNAYWTKGYVEYYFEPTWLHTLSWLSLPVVVLVAKLSQLWKPKMVWIEASVILALVAGFYVASQRISDSYLNKPYYTLQKQIHYADTEEWDKLIEVTDINPTNDLQAIYFHLGLSKKGRLLENLFLFPQQGIQSLMNNDVQYTDMGVLMSRVYYQMGLIGAAQNMSFSSSIGVTWGNPSMMKLLIKAYLINGRYQVAEKQIAKLEKSWYYGDWAKEQRKFLYNDEAVMADPELGKMRRSLPNNDEFTIINGPLYDLQMVLDANPDNREAAEYFIAMLLIIKEYSLIDAFVNRYYGHGCLTILPLRLQEAVVAIHEHDPAYCLSHGVNEETLERFATFREQVLTLRRNGITNMSRLAPEYRRTFWYYMLK